MCLWYLWRETLLDGNIPPYFVHMPPFSQFPPPKLLTSMPTLTYHPRQESRDHATTLLELEAASPPKDKTSLLPFSSYLLTLHSNNSCKFLSKPPNLTILITAFQDHNSHIYGSTFYSLRANPSDIRYHHYFGVGLNRRVFFHPPFY